MSCLFPQLCFSPIFKWELSKFPFTGKPQTVRKSRKFNFICSYFLHLSRRLLVSNKNIHTMCTAIELYMLRNIFHFCAISLCTKLPLCTMPLIHLLIENHYELEAGVFMVFALLEKKLFLIETTWLMSCC